MAYGVAFLLCAATDLFVLRPVWTSREVAVHQFRRGYFEMLDGQVGLAMDDAIRPDMLPTFLLTGDSAVAIPPG